MSATTPRQSAPGVRTATGFMFLFFGTLSCAAVLVALSARTATTDNPGAGAPVPADAAYVHLVAAQVPNDLHNTFDACMRDAIDQATSSGQPLLRSTVDDCETSAENAKEADKAAQAAARTRAARRAQYLAALK